MKFRTCMFPVSLFILIFSIAGCEEQSSGPKIEWLSGLTTTYSYSGGVPSGVNFYIKFNVIDDESGELSFDARLGSTEKSCSGFVEAGQQYSVIVRCTIGKEGSQSTIILEPSSESKSMEVSVTDYSVSLNAVDMN